jgi:hypothetical protein
MGFKRYKKPLVDHFIKEINEHGQLKKCKTSLMNFWVPLLDDTSATYIKKTKETPEDRTESVFFSQKGKTSAKTKDSEVMDVQEDNLNLLEE